MMRGMIDVGYPQTMLSRLGQSVPMFACLLAWMDLSGHGRGQGANVGGTRVIMTSAPSKKLARIPNFLVTTATRTSELVGRSTTITLRCLGR